MTRIGIKAGFVVIVMFVLFAMNCFYIKKKALVKISTKPTSSDFQYNVTRMKRLEESSWNPSECNVGKVCLFWGWNILTFLIFPSLDF
jgi:hypothetical protein